MTVRDTQVFKERGERSRGLHVEAVPQRGLPHMTSPYMRGGWDDRDIAGGYGGLERTGGPTEFRSASWKANSRNKPCSIHSRRNYEVHFCSKLWTICSKQRGNRHSP
jgi:hypothetical protein